MNCSALKSDTPDLEPGLFIKLQVTSYFLVATHERGTRSALTPMWFS